MQPAAAVDSESGGSVDTAPEISPSEASFPPSTSTTTKHSFASLWRELNGHSNRVTTVVLTRRAASKVFDPLKIFYSYLWNCYYSISRISSASLLPWTRRFDALTSRLAPLCNR